MDLGEDEKEGQKSNKIALFRWYIYNGEYFKSNSFFCGK